MRLTPLSFCVLPSRMPMRDTPGGYGDWDQAAQQAFDANTLFHDVFAAPEPGRIYAVGPPLKRAFRTLLKSADLRIDGIPATMNEISQSQRACVLEITAPVDTAHVLEISHPTMATRIAISPSALAQYKGARAMFTLSRNNTLDWVRDWARYHVDTQGVDAIVLFDNASDAYGADALLEVLARIDGLKTFDVIPAPFQYGPVGDGRERTSVRYLQFGLFEIIRLRFLGHAYGALNMDIDEMAHGPKGLSVFDAAKRSEAGFLTLPGSWRYPAPGAPLTHAAHTLRARQDAEMYPKWCIDPAGPQTGKSWRTHGIKKLPDQLQDGFGFFHCRMISESWHYDRSEYTDLTLETDPLALSLLSAQPG